MNKATSATDLVLLEVVIGLARAAHHQEPPTWTDVPRIFWDNPVPRITVALYPFFCSFFPTSNTLSYHQHVWEREEAAVCELADDKVKKMDSPVWPAAVNWAEAHGTLTREMCWWTGVCPRTKADWNLLKKKADWNRFIEIKEKSPSDLPQVLHEPSLPPSISKLEFYIRRALKTVWFTYLLERFWKAILAHVALHHSSHVAPMSSNTGKSDFRNSSERPVRLYKKTL
jgi:hypothetical protein